MEVDGKERDAKLFKILINLGSESEIWELQSGHFDPGGSHTLQTRDTGRQARQM